MALHFFFPFALVNHVEFLNLFTNLDYTPGITLDNLYNLVFENFSPDGNKHQTDHDPDFFMLNLLGISNPTCPYVFSWPFSYQLIAV